MLTRSRMEFFLILCAQVKPFREIIFRSAFVTFFIFLSVFTENMAHFAIAVLFYALYLKFAVFSSHLRFPEPSNINTNETWVKVRQIKQGMAIITRALPLLKIQDHSLHLCKSESPQLPWEACHQSS